MTRPSGWVGTARTRLERSEGSKRYMRERERSAQRRRRARIIDRLGWQAADIRGRPYENTTQELEDWLRDNEANE